VIPTTSAVLPSVVQMYNTSLFPFPVPLID
jgi:hypothetical protein